MSNSLFDPHHTNRRYSRRTQHKGQILQAKQCDTPHIINLRLVPIYREFIQNNPYYGTLPTPKPPDPVPIRVPLTSVQAGFYSNGNLLSTTEKSPLDTLSPNITVPTPADGTYQATLSFPSTSFPLAILVFAKTSIGTFVAPKLSILPNSAVGTFNFLMHFPQTDAIPINFRYLAFAPAPSSTRQVNFLFHPFADYQLSLLSDAVLYTQPVNSIDDWTFIDKEVFTFPWT